ncbi:MAG: hypothetical protein V4644_01635 [Patescibacteria group bacterium]
MNEDGEFSPRPVARMGHYHGDTVRILFVTAAVLIFATKFVPGAPTFSFGPMMLLILTLVIAAGITNPAQQWIHTVNLLLSIAGVVTFGWLSFSRIETASELFSGTGLVAFIAVIFLATLYFATRTVRGFSVPHVDAA